MDKELLGVVVGRFQTNVLTEAHRRLITTVCAECDRVIIVVGAPDKSINVDVSDKYIIPTPLIMEMVSNFVQSVLSLGSDDVKVSSLEDTKSSIEWSENLDSLIKIIEDTNNFEVVLYGGRDSFISEYVGGFKTVQLNFSDLEHVSATSIREKLKSSSGYSPEFIHGIVWNHYNSDKVYPHILALKLKVAEKILFVKGKTETLYSLPFDYLTGTIEGSVYSLLKLMFDKFINFEKFKSLLMSKITFEKSKMMLKGNVVIVVSVNLDESLADFIEYIETKASKDSWIYSTIKFIEPSDYLTKFVSPLTKGVL